MKNNLSCGMNVYENNEWTLGKITIAIFVAPFVAIILSPFLLLAGLGMLLHKH